MEKGIDKEEDIILREEIQRLMGIPLKPIQVGRINPLVLAYMGDAVFELYIRGYLIRGHKTQVNKLHRLATKFVRAETQSRIIHELIPDLNQDELAIVKRGRNSKPHTTPKNAPLSDYRYATGYEALLGYLYLSGNQERLGEIISQSIELIEK